MSMKNKDKNKNITINGLGSTLLLVAFIVLKLCHVIEWTWIWVLAPLWIPFVLTVIIIAVVAIWVNR